MTGEDDCARADAGYGLAPPVCGSIGACAGSFVQPPRPDEVVATPDGSMTCAQIGIGQRCHGPAQRKRAVVPIDPLCAMGCRASVGSLAPSAKSCSRVNWAGR
jgi:hypothetical protein